MVANVVAVIIMVVLQTYLIFVFPRLNLRIWPFFDRQVFLLTCGIDRSKTGFEKRACAAADGVGVTGERPIIRILNFTSDATGFFSLLKNSN
jgi:hypothetical protein